MNFLVLNQQSRLRQRAPHVASSEDMAYRLLSRLNLPRMSSLSVPMLVSFASSSSRTTSPSVHASRTPTSDLALSSASAAASFYPLLFTSDSSSPSQAGVRTSVVATTTSTTMPISLDIPSPVVSFSSGTLLLHADFVWLSHA